MNFGKDHSRAMECIFDIFITLLSERRADHLNSIYEKCRIRGTAISLYTHYTIGVFVNDFCSLRTRNVEFKDEECRRLVAPYRR